MSIKFSIDSVWQLILVDLGLSASDILKRAKLPADLFTRRCPQLDPESYFSLWQALADSADDSLLALNLGQSISVESFSPPMFAALCSPDFNVAMQRLREFKKLCGPMAMVVDVGASSTRVSIEFDDRTLVAPDILYVTELVFMTYLVRQATRYPVKPLKITAPVELGEWPEYHEYFGIEPEYSSTVLIELSTEDASRPFLTVNDKMWSFFEPELRQRVAELKDETRFTDKVRGALLELLPSGSYSIESVANALAVSKRTLQRRLSAEATHFQEELNRTREKLARYYLKNSKLPSAEISFLLGYEDPNSFFRAFHNWTGMTPESVRYES